MSNDDIVLLDQVQKIVQKCTKDPEAFLSVQDDMYEELKQATKMLYDLAYKIKSTIYPNSKALPELLIDGMDTEQIWQQIQFDHNEEFSESRMEEFSKMLANKEPFTIPPELLDGLNLDDLESCNEASEEQGNKDKVDKKEEDDDDDDDVNDDDEATRKEGKGKGNKEEREKVNDSLEGETPRRDNTLKRKKDCERIKKRRRTTEVDDKFFKLDELDDFLKKEDKREMKVKSKNDSSSDEESELDLFNDFSDDDGIDDDKNVNDDEENGKLIKYRDFFDAPESDNEDHDEDAAGQHGREHGSEGDSNQYENENEFEDNNDDNDDDDDDDDDDDEPEKISQEKRRVKFDLPNDSDTPDEPNETSRKEEKSNLEEEEEEEKKSEDVKSSLEARQERLKKRIKELEKEAVSEKPWQMMGEASALTRPQNSLLEEHVEFDSATRPAPIITEQTTMKLEDIIRGRIKDKTWDDVIKKFKPVDTPKEFKKQLVMNQEKSKESLAQIYENEYVKQREALNMKDGDEEMEIEAPEHIEIRKDMHHLFQKLDALSNFHYTPKLAQPEVKIISNVPAIMMEEVAPVTMTDATLLAPEEIKPKEKGNPIGRTERTKTDMRRERRKKKSRQHARAVNESKRLAEGIKQKKSLKNPVLLKKLKGRNIIDVSEETSKANDKAIKSSTAFFAKLQDEVKGIVKDKTSKRDDNTKRNKNASLSVAKLKL